MAKQPIKNVFDDEGNLIASGPPGAIVPVSEDAEVSAPDESVDEPTEAPESDLESLTVAELRDRASDLDIEGYSTMRKAELVEAIQGA